jgi:hypothetical protein
MNGQIHALSSLSLGKTPGYTECRFQIGPTVGLHVIGTEVYQPPFPGSWFPFQKPSSPHIPSTYCPCMFVIVLKRRLINHLISMAPRAFDIIPSALDQTSNSRQKHLRTAIVVLLFQHPQTQSTVRCAQGSVPQPAQPPWAVSYLVIQCELLNCDST